MAIKTTVLPDTLTSNGNAFDLSNETFGELRDSKSLLGDTAALHERFAEDGYLLLRGYLDKEKVLAARRELIGKLDEIGLIDRSRPFMDPSSRVIPAASARATARNSRATSAPARR